MRAYIACICQWRPIFVSVIVNFDFVCIATYSKCIPGLSGIFDWGVVMQGPIVNVYGDGNPERSAMAMKRRLAYGSRRLSNVKNRQSHFRY